MLRAYLDESGIHDGSQVCVVAGYFGGSGRWKEFETDWKRLLHRFDVPMEEFHAKDLFPKRKGWFSHKWSQRHRHKELLNEIACTIAGHEKVHPIAIGVFVDDFNSLSIEERRYFTGADIDAKGKITSSGCPGKPYFLPFQLCVIHCCQYAASASKAHFFFGLDHKQFGGYATALFQQIQNSELRTPELGLEWKERLGTLSFPLAKETPQIQAADFLVNLTYNYVLSARDAIEREQPPPAPPLLSKCITNARSLKDDFFVLNKRNFRVQLQQAREFSEMKVRLGT